MNKRKFEVIIHATDEAACRRLIQSLQMVVVPENFSAEIQTVTGNEKYFAYDTAMRASDAKYKIYLDEHAVITNANFLNEILEIFADASIGAVGTSGAVELSTHGVSLTSAKRAAPNFRGEVEIVDGFFFATQYDLPWRTDLFTDNFFGGQAQCVEFKRAGYKIFIGGDWITYAGENFTLDETSRQKFLDEYSTDLFPLVSIVIPTFNRPKYFREALESAINQTYRNIEIVISDDSTNDETEHLMQGYLARDARIKYFRNRGFTSHDNWNFLRDYDNPAAEYVNWLMDDDLFYPPKIEKMVEIYRTNPDVSLVTSKRNIIDANGNITSESKTPFTTSGKISGENAARILFGDYYNYIGEPTTVLIRKKFLRNGDLCWHDDERGFYTLVDMATWLQLLTKGNLYFICEILSGYRWHDEVSSRWVYNPPLVAIQWVKMIKSAWNKNFFLKTETDLRHAILNWFSFMGVYCLKLPLEKNYHGKEVESLEKYFVVMSQALSNGYKLELPPVEYSEQDELNKMN